MSSPNENVLRNVAGGLLAGYGFVAFFCFMFLVLHWANIAPRAPDPAHALVFPHNEHGAITYFSAFQATSCALLFATSVPLAFIGMIIAPKKNAKSISGRLSWSAKWDQDDPKRILKWSAALGGIVAPVIVFLLGPSLVEGLNAIGFAVNF